jgi:hypothetical protein
MKPSMTARTMRITCASITAVGAAAGLLSCTRITIDPTCPDELEVTESGEVRANVQQPGAVPTYLWQVIPADAGRFANPDQPNTTFEALKTGEAALRLTASDSLFQEIAVCRTNIVPPSGMVVSLRAEPQRPFVGEITNLTCESVGQTTATQFTLEQVAGIEVTLASTGTGTARFTPSQTGELQFRCEGRTSRGRDTAEASVTVTVVAPPPDNTNDNGNTNDNSNDNTADNQNDNTIGNTNTNDNMGGA